MQLRVRHLTTYTYSHPISYAIQTLRLTPRSYDGLTVLRWQVRGDRSRPLPSFIDGLGNVVHANAINRPHQTASILVEGEAITQATDGVVQGAPEPLPPAYFLRPTPLTMPDAAIAALAAEAGPGLRERLFALMVMVGNRIVYQEGATDAATTAAQALALGCGVCQDHAHVFIAACRGLGIPARYVSGYLWMGDNGTTRPANHAWAEAYLEGLGWIGYDPANQTQPTDAYIRVAAGLDSRAAAPVRGVRRGEAGETLSVAVQVGPVESTQ